MGMWRDLIDSWKATRALWKHEEEESQRRSEAPRRLRKAAALLPGDNPGEGANLWSFEEMASNHYLDFAADYLGEIALANEETGSSVPIGFWVALAEACDGVPELNDHKQFAQQMLGEKIRSILFKHSELPFERLQVITDISQFDIARIRRGIVFVFAPWSNPAVANWTRLTRVLSPMDVGSFELVVLYHDCMTDKDMVRVFGHVFRGYGEILWILDGRVIAESSATQPESLILEHTTELLADDHR